MRKYISMFPYSYIVKALLSGGDKRAEDLSKPPTKKLQIWMSMYDLPPLTGFKRLKSID